MRALVSVYDKTGLKELAESLIQLDVTIISTGGTLAFLCDHGIAAESVESVTGFPEILDGRVKTLHPHIHGGLLARRDLESHTSDLRRHEIVPIDIVVANLYPFEETIADPQCKLIDALEYIDIGGPAIIRAAAKNFPAVIVLTTPADYGDAIDRLRNGTADELYRRSLATRAFQHVSLYDALVAGYLGAPEEHFPTERVIPARLSQPLRYGENPHQRAVAYQIVSVGSASTGVLAAAQLQGKELSYNNLLDSDAAIRLANRFSNATAVVIKHAIPCGLACRATAAAAVDAALACDPLSAYGGIVAVNRIIDADTAAALKDMFLEVVVAPEFTADARSQLATRKSLRLLELPVAKWSDMDARSIRSITGGLLIQEDDTGQDAVDAWRVVTKVSPSTETMTELRFAWEACRFVRSNAIVLAKDRMMTGVGPGQPNRLDSVRLAIQRAGNRAAGSVLASDAFFPFADGVEVALAAGVVAIVQPGGSVRDADVIGACDLAGVPMVFTGIRHFLH